jgi:CubicO group peptidase (beta-lactamase class C family)
MTDLHGVLAQHVGNGTVPGAVGLVARGDSVEIAEAGEVTRESVFRIASITKPVVAAAVLMLVEDGRLTLDEPVGHWLPEIAAPAVVRTPGSPVDDVVPAARPITVADLLTFRAGYGFPEDFSLPALGPLFTELKQGPPQPQSVAPPDEWMAALGRIPLLYQPGEAWLYNTCSDIQGVLIARVTGRPLPEFLAERVFEPLRMVDTGFAVPAGAVERLSPYYRRDPDGGRLQLVDPPDGQWSSMPAFPSGAGGLVSTLDDWYRFGRMLLAGGGALLSPDSVRLMMTDHLTPAQRAASRLFLEGQGWGYGGSVDVERVDPWNVPGRYGWVGGTGTTAHVIPSTGWVTILLTQVEMAGPTPPAVMRDFWRYAAG